MPTLSAALGFLLSAVIVPSFFDAAYAPRWACLSVLAPIILWVAWPRFKPLHVLLVAILGWGAFSCLWSVVPWQSWGWVWRFSLLAMLCICSSEIDFKAFWRGSVLAMLISSIFVIGQVLGFPGVEMTVRPAGLFMNMDLLAETAAPVLIVCVVNRWWPEIVAISPCLLGPWFFGYAIPGSRTSILALLVPLAALLWRRSRVLVLGLSAATLLFVLLTHVPSNAARATYWLNSLRGFTPLGWGIGSWEAMYPLFAHLSPMDPRPEYAHSDFIEIFVEFGIAALLFVPLFHVKQTKNNKAEYYVLLALAVEMGVAFPLRQPSTAAMVSLCLGACVDDRDWLRIVSDLRARATRAWKLGADKQRNDLAICARGEIRPV